MRAAPSEEGGSEIKYVVTNPAQDLMLKEDDVVFVLAQADPREHNAWDEARRSSSTLDLEKMDSQKETRNRDDDLFNNAETKNTQGDDDDIIEIKPNDQMQG